MKSDFVIRGNSWYGITNRPVKAGQSVRLRRSDGTIHEAIAADESRIHGSGYYLFRLVRRREEPIYRKVASLERKVEALTEILWDKL